VIKDQEFILTDSRVCTVNRYGVALELGVEVDGPDIVISGYSLAILI